MVLESKEQRFTLRCGRSQLCFAFDIEFVKATSCLSVSSFLSILSSYLPVTWSYFYILRLPFLTERQFFFFGCLKLVRAGTAQVRGLVSGRTHLLTPGLYCTCTVQSLMELWAWLLLPPRHQCNINNNRSIFSSESLKLCCSNTVCRSWQSRLCLCSHGCGVLDEIFSWDLKRHSKS